MIYCDLEKYSLGGTIIAFYTVIRKKLHIQNVLRLVEGPNPARKFFSQFVINTARM